LDQKIGKFQIDIQLLSEQFEERTAKSIRMLMKNISIISIFSRDHPSPVKTSQSLYSSYSGEALKLAMFWSTTSAIQQAVNTLGTPPTSGNIHSVRVFT